VFAGDLAARCTCGYAERVGCEDQILDVNESDLGGYKDVQVAVKAKSNHDPGQGCLGRG